MPARPLAGSWTLVRVENIGPDGVHTQPYGPHPQGLLVFDPAGGYAIQIYRPGRARFASGDKSAGTEAEVRAAIEGANTHFGHYALDPAGRTMSFQIEHALFPNWEGTRQVRRLELKGDSLTYVVPEPTSGGRSTAEVEWRRLK
jgi:hypothetical protein